MKKHSLICALAIVAGFSISALADDAPAVNAKKCSHHGGYKSRGFSAGLCIGQTLAQQGVILPPRVAGQRPVFDAATKAAFEAAKQSCRAQRTK